MSKNISVALKAHLALPVSTLATLWLLTRTDSVVMGFTDHDSDILFNSVTYKAATGLSGTTSKGGSDGAVDNSSAYGILNSNTITEIDLAAGVYDFASIQVMLVNYQDLTQGSLTLTKGWLGEATRHRNRFETEIRSLSQKLQQPVGRVVSATCDTDLGSTRCGINLASWTVTGTVTSVTDSRTFVASAMAQASAYFQGGQLTFTSGLNNGRAMEVKTFTSGGSFVLVQPLPFTVAIGNTFSVYKGCDKTPQGATNGCVSFSNVVNFQGFPFLPGIDNVLRYPAAH